MLLFSNLLFSNRIEAAATWTSKLAWDLSCLSRKNINTSTNSSSQTGSPVWEWALSPPIWTTAIQVTCICSWRWKSGSSSLRQSGTSIRREASCNSNYINTNTTWLYNIFNIFLWHYFVNSYWYNSSSARSTRTRGEVWKSRASAPTRASHQRRSRWSSLTWPSSWARGAESPTFNGNTDCYHGNMHRFHGNHDLNGNQDGEPAGCHGHGGGFNTIL